MANSNKALSAAGQAKKDEFYTQLVDIENELRQALNGRRSPQAVASWR